MPDMAALAGKTQPDSAGTSLRCNHAGTLHVCCSLSVFGLAPPACNTRQHHSTLHAPTQHWSKACNCRRQAMCHNQTSRPDTCLTADLQHAWSLTTGRAGTAMLVTTSQRVALQDPVSKKPPCQVNVPLVSPAAQLPASRWLRRQQPPAGPAPVPAPCSGRPPAHKPLLLTSPKHSGKLTALWHLTSQP